MLNIKVFKKYNHYLHVLQQCLCVTLMLATIFLADDTYERAIQTYILTRFYPHNSDTIFARLMVGVLRIL
jgi:hypothetical protein